MKLQDLYNEYKRLSQITDAIEIEDNKDAWLEAYENEWNAMGHVINEIKRLTKVDTPTARAMMCSEKFEQLMGMVIA